MGPGDMVVCGVIGDVILDDIHFSVPKGHAVTIPADLVVRSTDLHRQLSQGAIFQLNKNSLLRLKLPRAEEPVPVPEVAVELGVENESLRAENGRLQAENGRLQGDVGRLQGEVAKLKKELLDAKSSSGKLEGRLDEIMTLLKDRPATVIQQVVGQNGTKSSTSEPNEGAAPTFIPSQIRPENVDASRISVQEKSAEAGGISQAASALRKLKEKQTDQ